MNVWGIHMGRHVGSDPVDNGYIGIGWHQLGDLALIEDTREAIKAELADKIEYEKPGAIPVHAGVLYRFKVEMTLGDIVIYPSKSDRLVNIGEITGNYEFVERDDNGYPNHRSIRWIGSFPRTDFKQSALNEIGSAMTMFMVNTHRDDFLEKVGLSDTELSAATSSDEPDDESVTESVAQQAQLTTEDFIIKRLHSRLTHYEFEYFVAHLLECMGYTTRVSEQSSDGGVDVIAHNDQFGFVPPILKVQCKQSTGSNGEPEASQLLGTLGEGEYALFVNLGSYSRPARMLERNKAKLRLIDGSELAELVVEHYSKMSPRYRTILPLKQIHVPDLNKSDNQP
ncbi:MAG: restriction system protein [Arenicella sp.]|jgi:restriction system protein